MGMRYGRQEKILHWKSARICRGVGEVRGRGSASAHVSASAHAGQVTPPRLTDDSRGASSALSFTHLALVGVLAHEGLPEALGAIRLLAGGNERVRHRGRDHLFRDGGSGNGLGQRTSWTGEQINPKTCPYLCVPWWRKIRDRPAGEPGAYLPPLRPLRLRDARRVGTVTRHALPLRPPRGAGRGGPLGRPVESAGPHGPAASTGTHRRPREAGSGHLHGEARHIFELSTSLWSVTSLCRVSGCAFTRREDVQGALSVVPTRARWNGKEQSSLQMRRDGWGKNRFRFLISPF